MELSRWIPLWTVLTVRLCNISGLTETKKPICFSIKRLQPHLSLYPSIYLYIHHLSIYLPFCQLKIAWVTWRGSADCRLLLTLRPNETPGLPSWTSISCSSLQQWSISAQMTEYTFVPVVHIFLECTSFTFLKMWAFLWLTSSRRSPYGLCQISELLLLDQHALAVFCGM